MSGPKRKPPDLEAAQGNPGHRSAKRKPAKTGVVVESTSVRVPSWLGLLSRAGCERPAPPPKGQVGYNYALIGWVSATAWGACLEKKFDDLADTWRRLAAGSN